MPNWRQHSAKVISELIGSRIPRRLSADELNRLRKEISDAFPFGPRRHHPYKIWLSEVANQLALPREPKAGDMPLFEGAKEEKR